MDKLWLKIEQLRKVRDAESKRDGMDDDAGKFKDCIDTGMVRRAMVVHSD